MARIEKEASRNLGDPSQSWRKLSMQTERTIHRDAEAAMEVRLADSTRSVEKPRTRGSDETKLGLR